MQESHQVPIAMGNLSRYKPEVLAQIPEFARRFQVGKPYRHVIIDGLFDERFLREVARDFPGPEDASWYRFADQTTLRKLQNSDDTSYPPILREFTRELNSGSFLRLVSEITGIEGIVPDPYLHGGGLHQTLPGGFLKVHTDFNRHPYMDIDRRLNLLVYLNDGWEAAWGGQFELWDRSMAQCEERVLPLFNRTVIFLTDSHSYHGHPDPLACPEGVTRKSVAMYYYTNGRPSEELDNFGRHTITRFRERPGEEVFTSRHLRIMNRIAPWLPAPLVSLAKVLRPKP